MKTNTLKHQFTVTKANEKTTIKISLDDDCKNGHEDFSLTADIYERTPKGWRDSGGGCCHDHILALRPELATFARLHLATCDGVPMHAIANAWYWFQGAFPDSAESGGNRGPCHGGTGSSGKSPDECRRIFGEHILATPEQVQTIAGKNPRSQVELQFILEEMGFPAQWKAEAGAAIRQLEEWTGNEFESKATKQCWQPLTEEQKTDILHKRESGYYSPEQVADRDVKAKEADKQKRLSALRKDYEARMDTLKRCFDVESQLIEKFGHKPNFIYYDHTNELSANWSNRDKLLTKDEFDAITQALDYSKLPAGIKMVWNERPKY